MSELLDVTRLRPLSEQMRQVGDERYRMELRREVDMTGFGELAWFMLNPSTATATKNDPTIRRCIDFTRHWGFRSMRVVNLLPWRSTDPRAALRRYRQCPPFEGQYFTNMLYQERACTEADAVILAWGSHGWEVGGEDALERACCLTDEAWVLGWTANGSPRHPLYVRADTKPVHADDDSRRWWR